MTLQLILLTVLSQLDPAGWGSDHVGQPVPEYVTGDQCLFCHRNDIGPAWSANRHNLTTRAGRDGEFILGARTRNRALKSAGYGRLSIRADGAWDATRFGDRCAGCHTTGVDSKTRTFGSHGLDCYTCHGAVDLKHSNDTALVWLSKKRRDDAKAVISICGQCHLRGGVSRSTGLPYADTFVAGDNLFRDFRVDFALADNEKLNAADRHVYRSARDVAISGSSTTCLNCHRVHAGSSARHRLVLSSRICFDCHYEQGPRKNVKPLAVTSATCEY